MNGHHLVPAVPRVAAGNKIEPVFAKMEMLEMLDARETSRNRKTANYKSVVSFIEFQFRFCQKVAILK